jgi:hypothetical protein
VLAHEAAHQLSLNGFTLQWLGVARQLLLALGLFIPSGTLLVWLVRTQRGVALRLLLPPVVALGGAAMAWLVAMAALARVSTRFEYSAHAKGLQLLVAAGWPPERALRAFRGFLAHSPGRAADPWFAEGRHPSNADRERAVQVLLLRAPESG